MLNFIITAIKIIFVLGFLIFIHEGGHFLVAKLCKVRVNEFAIGFGPTIWKKQGKETKYALRLIPLGGFVSMEGEEEHSDKEGSFSKASVWKRIAIVSAGAIVNIIFAIIVFFILASILQGNIGYGIMSTKKFIGSIFESLKMMFTGKVGMNDMMTSRIRKCCFFNHRNSRFRLYTICNFVIFRSNKFTTNTSIRWWKNINFINRSNTKKTYERRLRNKNTNVRFCFLNNTFFNSNI